jgi:ubiquinone/menaquinone biosynthesis C-methylase UbiE
MVTTTDPGQRTDGPRQGRLNAQFGVEAGFWSDLYSAHGVLATIHRYRMALTLSWIDALELPGRARALEVGCGAGRLSVEMARRGFEVDATDPVDPMRELAREAAAHEGLTDRMRVSAADVQALPFPDRSFRLVVGLGVLPWIDDIDAAVAEMARVLVSGGHLIVTINSRTPLHTMADPVRLPILAPLRDGARQKLPAIRTESRSPRLRPIGFARPVEFASQLEAQGLRLIRSQAFGFGPFTLLGRQVLPDRLGVGLEQRLQRRVERGDRWLDAGAAQYLVLAGRPAG